MAVSRPGEVEWRGVLFAMHPDDSDLWLPNYVERDDWYPHYIVDNPATVYGASRGMRRPAAMYPTLRPVLTDDPDAAVGLWESMLGDETPDDLEWWDLATDKVYTATAVGERCEIGIIEPDLRTIDLQWFIGDPSTIEEVDGS